MGLGGVDGGSVGCGVKPRGMDSVVNRSLCTIVAWSRVILGFLGVIDWGSKRGCVIFGLAGAVLEGFGVASSCNVGCGVVNWSISVVSQFSLVLRGGRCAVILAASDVVVSQGGVVNWGSVGCGAVLRSLGGASWGSVDCSVVIWHFGVVFDCFSGVIN